MRRTSAYFGKTLVVRLALLALCAIIPGPGMRGQQAALEVSETASAEQELFRLANRERAQASVAPLQWNEHLAQAARLHAAEMARRGALSHQFSGELSARERLAATDLRFDASAENVGAGPDTAEVHDGWMRSQGHRTNILNPRYNAIGIAVVRRGKFLYAVQDFAHRVTKYTDQEFEDQVAAALDHLRAEVHMRPMKRSNLPELRRMACAMAKKDRLDASGLFLGNWQVQTTIAFTEPDPERLSTHLDRVRRSGPYDGFAVGACFAKSPTYPEGTNWVIVVFR